MCQGNRGEVAQLLRGQVHPVPARGVGQGLCVILSTLHDDTFLGPSLCPGVLRVLLADTVIWMRPCTVSQQGGRAAGTGGPLAVSPCSGWVPETVPYSGQRQVLPGAEAESWAAWPSSAAAWSRGGVAVGVWLPLLWL